MGTHCRGSYHPSALWFLLRGGVIDVTFIASFSLSAQFIFSACVWNTNLLCSVPHDFPQGCIYVTEIVQIPNTGYNIFCTWEIVNTSPPPLNSTTPIDWWINWNTFQCDIEHVVGKHAHPCHPDSWSACGQWNRCINHMSVQDRVPRSCLLWLWGCFHFYSVFHCPLNLCCICVWQGHIRTCCWYSYEISLLNYLFLLRDKKMMVGYGIIWNDNFQIRGGFVPLFKSLIV